VVTDAALVHGSRRSPGERLRDASNYCDFPSAPEIILPHVETLLNVDDDEIVERALLCAYGALIAAPDKEALKSLAETLLTIYESSPAAFRMPLSEIISDASVSWLNISAILMSDSIR